MYPSFSTGKNVNRQQVVEYAKKKLKSNPVYLDTETTGLESKDEIIEIAIVNSSGKVIFESFVRPQKAIPASATAINNITNTMVANSPSWADIWPSIRNLLLGHPIGMYNAEFDIRMILQSLEINKIPNITKLSAFDIMKVYSDYMRSDRRFRLEQAGRNLGIVIPNSHRAADDTLLTRAIFHSIAGVPY
jgi:DNA polymerase III epsilon subunit-like protein